MSNPNDGSPSFSSQAWRWVIVPLVVVIFVGASALTLVINRRRNRRLRYQVQRLDPRGHSGLAALERDLEAQRRRDARSRRRSAAAAAAAGGGRSRWAWPTGPFGGIRPDEGLNELGEAPPPYIGRDDGGPKDEAGEPIALETLGSRRHPPPGGARLGVTAEAGGEDASGSRQHQQQPHGLTPAVPDPPAYDSPPRDVSTVPPPPAPPPPAALPMERLGRDGL